MKFQYLKQYTRPLLIVLLLTAFLQTFNKPEENNSATTQEGTQLAFVGSIFSTVLLTGTFNLLKTTKSVLQLRE